MHVGHGGRQAHALGVHVRAGGGQADHHKDLPTYYESLKTSNANLARRPAILFPGVARKASYFVIPRDKGDVILILRQDCVVNINASGLTQEEAQKVAAAAGR